MKQCSTLDRAIGLVLIVTLMTCSCGRSETVHPGRRVSAELVSRGTEQLIEGRDGYRAHPGKAVPVSLLDSASSFHRALLLGGDKEALERYLLSLDEIAIYLGRGPKNFAAITSLSLGKHELSKQPKPSYDTRAQIARAYWLLGDEQNFQSTIERLRSDGYRSEVEESMPWFIKI